MPASSISSIWKRSRSASRARARSSPPSPSSSVAQRAGLGPGRAQLGERHGGRLTGVAVEHRPLHRGDQQVLVRVLPVQVDEGRADLGELPRGREAPVDVRA